MLLLNLFKRLLILGALLLVPNIAFAQTCVGTPPLTQIVVDNTIDICLPINNANEISALALRQTLQTMTSALFQSFTQTVPNTQTGTTYSVVSTDYSIIANNSTATLTLTLLSAALYPGQILNIKTTQNQTVVSASSNVVPLIGGAAGTAILSATAGKWAQLQSDGSNWIILAGN